jgi:mRNA interferase RelE/StbE
VRVIFDSEAAKALRRSPERERLTAKIRQLAADPASLANNVTRLVGRPESRLRVGDWRIIFHIEGETLFIDAIGPRGSIYG